MCYFLFTSDYWPPYLIHHLPWRGTAFSLAQSCCLTPKTWVWLAVGDSLLSCVLTSWNKSNKRLGPPSWIFYCKFFPVWAYNICTIHINNNCCNFGRRIAEAWAKSNIVSPWASLGRNSTWKYVLRDGNISDNEHCDHRTLFVAWTMTNFRILWFYSWKLIIIIMIRTFKHCAN